MTIAADLKRLAKRVERVATVMAECTETDVEALALGSLEVAYAKYELWLAQNDLRLVQSRAVAKVFGGEATAPLLNMLMGAPATLVHGMSPVIWRSNYRNPKLTAILSILETITGIPIDALMEYFASDLNRLLEEFANWARARRTRGPDSPQARRAWLRIQGILRRILRLMTSRRFARWLARRLGPEVAEQILRRLGAYAVPIAGWAAFLLMFAALLTIWGEILFDP